MKSFSNQQVTFVEAEFKNEFYCTPIEANETWAIEQGATHKWINKYGDFRFLTIGTTIAFMIVDEDANGNAVKEKWSIKHI